jgi:hypothetical protein
MKYMANEMLEEFPEILRKDGIDCRTVHEWLEAQKGFGEMKPDESNSSTFVLESLQEQIMLIIVIPSKLPDVETNLRGH